MSRQKKLCKRRTENHNQIEQGTRFPQATGRDDLFPPDCGKNPDGTGKLCFPDGILCQNSKDPAAEKSR